MSAIVVLCEENIADDCVLMWIKIYAFTVLSGVLFPRAPYGARWGMLHYTENIQQIGPYNWAETVWRVIVETTVDTQKKLCAGPLSEVQLNGFSPLI